MPNVKLFINRAAAEQGISQFLNWPLNQPPVLVSVSITDEVADMLTQLGFSVDSYMDDNGNVQWNLYKVECSDMFFLATDDKFYPMSEAQEN